MLGFPEGQRSNTNPQAIDANYWKKGLGKRLLSFWERRAKNTWRKKISLGAAKKPTDVVGFYARSGYLLVPAAARMIIPMIAAAAPPIRASSGSAAVIAVLLSGMIIVLFPLVALLLSFASVGPK